MSRRRGWRSTRSGTGRTAARPTSPTCSSTAATCRTSARAWVRAGAARIHLEALGCLRCGALTATRRSLRCVACPRTPRRRPRAVVHDAAAAGQPLPQGARHGGCSQMHTTRALAPCAREWRLLPTRPAGLAAQLGLPGPPLAVPGAEQGASTPAWRRDGGGGRAHHPVRHADRRAAEASVGMGVSSPGQRNAGPSPRLGGWARPAQCWSPACPDHAWLGSARLLVAEAEASASGANRHLCARVVGGPAGGLALHGRPQAAAAPPQQQL